MIVFAGQYIWTAKAYQNHNLIEGSIYLTDLKAIEALPEKSTIFFLHWSDRIPAEVLKKHICIGFHMTDLPYGRGGHPLQNLILRGHKETVISAYQMTDKMDAGPVYTKSDPIPLEGKAEDIYFIAAQTSIRMAAEIIARKLEPKEQEGKATIFKRRKNGPIPVNGVMEDIYNHIRMLDADFYPLAYINHGQFHIAFSDAVYDKETELMEAKAYFCKCCVK